MEAVGAKSSEMLFFQLSSECTAQILSYLLWNDLNTLLLTGHRIVLEKIHRHVTQIDAQLGSLEVYPISAFNYPRLKSLIVRTNYLMIGGEREYEPYYVINDALCKSHPLLETLEIHGLLAFSILAPGHYLDTLLPGLTSLKLVGTGYLDRDYFQNIPPKLINFCVHSKRHSESEPVDTLPLSLVGRLPRSLATFELSRIALFVEDDSMKNISFPPGLTRLFCKLNDFSRVQHLLPSTLRSLKLRLQGRILWKVSLTSRFFDLTSLALSCDMAFLDFSIWVDVPFPTSITSLQLPNACKVFDSLGNQLYGLDGLLPRSLTSFRGLDGCHANTDWSNTTPLLQHATLSATIFKNNTIPSHLPPLVSLDVRVPLQGDNIHTALPTTLTCLQANVQPSSTWQQAVAKLNRLQTLKLMDYSGQLPSTGFWDVLKARLTSLSVSLHHLETLKDLETGWNLLRALTLKTSLHKLPALPLKKELDHRTSAHNLVPIRLPSSLVSLIIDAVQYSNLFIQPIDYITQLETLDITLGKAVSTNPEGKGARCLAFFRSFPASLTSLSVLTPKKLSSVYLESLPEGLKSLKVLTTSSIGEEWTNEFLASLPRKLIDLTGEKRKRVSTETDYESEAYEDADYLPPTLISFRLKTELCMLRTDAYWELYRQLKGRDLKGRFEV